MKYYAVHSGPESTRHFADVENEGHDTYSRQIWLIVGGEMGTQSRSFPISKNSV